MDGSSASATLASISRIGLRLDVRVATRLPARCRTLQRAVSRRCAASDSPTIYHVGDADAHAGPVPPLDEQRAIADYLDRETARIDTLIEEQQRLIEMLRERRAAVIDAALLDGLDRRASRALALDRRVLRRLECGELVADGERSVRRDRRRCRRDARISCSATMTCDTAVRDR